MRPARHGKPATVDSAAGRTTAGLHPSPNTACGHPTARISTCATQWAEWSGRHPDQAACWTDVEKVKDKKTINNSRKFLCVWEIEICNKQMREFERGPKPRCETDFGEFWILIMAQRVATVCEFSHFGLADARERKRGQLLQQSRKVGAENRFRHHMNTKSMEDVKEESKRGSN